MNLCIVSFQAVLLAVLVHYHYITKVEAKKQSYVSIGNWFSSIEKKADDVPDRIRMNKVYQQIKKTTENILAYPRRFMDQAFGTGTDNKDTMNKDHNESVEMSDLLNSQEQRDLLAVKDFSDLTGEVKISSQRYEAEPEASRQVHFVKQEAPKTKRRTKKHKKKNKGKHDQREHLPHEQRLDASVEQDKAEFGKKVMRRNHKKREKERINQRKFVKTLPKESNSSESEEVKRRKPVDIIVHIKMND